MKKFTVFSIIMLVLGIILLGIGASLTYSDSYWNFKNNPVSYTKSLPDGVRVSSIEIDAAFCNFNIYPGEDFLLEARNVPDEIKLTMRESGGVLRIKPEKKYKVFNGLNVGNVKKFGTYNLYIPYDMYSKFDASIAFSDIHIDNPATFSKANIDVSFSQFNAYDFDVLNNLSVTSAYSGVNIELANNLLSRITADNSFGSLTFRNVEFISSMEIDNSFGECNITVIGDAYNVSKSNGFGEVNYYGIDGSKGDPIISVSNAFGSTTLTARAR